MLYSYSMIVITIWRRRDFLQISTGEDEKLLEILFLG
jgi:hypothetical protein